MNKWRNAGCGFSAGNLLVLTDGRVGFIDFGIVGKISPLTFQALQAFLVSTMSADYDMMARALITMGATQETVIIPVCLHVNLSTMTPRIASSQCICQAAAHSCGTHATQNMLSSSPQLLILTQPTYDMQQSAACCIFHCSLHRAWWVKEHTFDKRYVIWQGQGCCEQW